VLRNGTYLALVKIEENMNIKIKDIIAVGLLSTLLFPVILVLIMMLSGVLHLSVGMDNQTSQNLSHYLERILPEQRESDLSQSKLFEANRLKEVELNEKEMAIKREIERLESLILENNQLKSEIDKNKKAIEQMISDNKVLSDERIEALAQLYGNMKPVEAAPILLNLENKNIAEIIAKIPETRSQAKIMAGIGAMDQGRAAEISILLGWRKP
jgi:flagellar motility protein MotE (MotC chaperone)